MPRVDDGLAFMLKYENVAWYQDGAVRILDRRVYPQKVEFVVCRDYRLREAALDRGEAVGPATEKFVLERVEATYLRARTIGENVVALLPEKVTILTQCFAEWLIGFTLLVCQERGKDAALICPETRPYLQGARLAASVARDMGVPVTVVTDNMPGYLLSRRIPAAFICAADVITLDGHVV